MMNSLQFQDAAVRFRDREQAGKALAAQLTTALINRTNLLVLGLPRGGVVVAHEVALALNAPLDVFIVRKLSLPGHSEVSLGLTTSGGVRVLNNEVITRLHIPPAVVDKVATWEEHEVARREQAYRSDFPGATIEGKVVLLVDDGLASSGWMRAAITSVRNQRPAKVIVAVPVASLYTCRALEDIADEVVCEFTPEPFRAIGLWYDNFEPATDEDISRLVSHARRTRTERVFDDEDTKIPLTSSEPVVVNKIDPLQSDPLRGIREVVTDALVSTPAGHTSTLLTTIAAGLEKLSQAQNELRTVGASDPSVQPMLTHQSELIERALSPLVELQGAKSEDAKRIENLISAIARLDVRLAHGHLDIPHFDVELSAESSSNCYRGVEGNDVASSGGLFISTALPPPAVGSNVTVWITFPSGDAAELMGRITFIQPHLSDETPAGFGLQLLDVPKESARLIAEFARVREPLFRDVAVLAPPSHAAAREVNPWERS